MTMFSNKTTNVTEGAATVEKKSWKERVAEFAIPTLGVAAVTGLAAGAVHVIRGKRKAAEIMDDWKEDDAQAEQPETKPVDPQKEADLKAMETISSMLDIYEAADDETVLAASNTFIAAGESVCTEEFYERNFETNLKFFGRYEKMVKRIRELQDAEAKRAERFGRMYHQLKVDLGACIEAVESTYIDTKLEDLNNVLPLARSIRERISGDFGIFVMEHDTNVLHDALSITDMVKAEIDFQERKRRRADDIDVDSLAEQMNASAIPDHGDEFTDVNAESDAVADLAKAVLKKVNDTIG